MCEMMFLENLQRTIEEDHDPVFGHMDIWAAVDRLAREKGLSASGLARKAGLDPTTFNPSKRVTKEGKARWPSTESLAKILDATGTTMTDFVRLMSGDAAGAGPPPTRRLPAVALQQAHAPGLFDGAGFPVGGEWDEVDFPGLDDRHAYAIEVHDASLAPTYRDGDVLIVSPGASIRRHDRVVLKATSGKIAFGHLERRSNQRITLRAFTDGASELVFKVAEVSWLARIVWTSQ